MFVKQRNKILRQSIQLWTPKPWIPDYSEFELRGLHGQWFESTSTPPILKFFSLQLSRPYLKIQDMYSIHSGQCLQLSPNKSRWFWGSVTYSEWLESSIHVFSSVINLHGRHQPPFSFRLTLHSSNHRCGTKPSSPELQKSTGKADDCLWLQSVCSSTLWPPLLGSSGPAWLR